MNGSRRSGCSGARAMKLGLLLALLVAPFAVPASGLAAEVAPKPAPQRVTPSIQAPAAPTSQPASVKTPLSTRSYTGQSRLRNPELAPKVVTASKGDTPFQYMNLLKQRYADVQEQHHELLQKLGLPFKEPTRADLPTKVVISNAERPIAENVKLLTKEPFVNPSVSLTRPERQAITHLTLDHEYSTLMSPAVKVSNPDYQNVAQKAYGSLGHRLQGELGVSPTSFGGHIVVVEGGGTNADSFNAVTLMDGSIVVHRRVFDVAAGVGLVAASSHNKEDLWKNMQNFVLGRFHPPANVDPKVADGYANAFAKLVIGHEMTHGMRDHDALGLASRGETTQESIQAAARSPKGLPRQRAFETISDGGGAELTTRDGDSPLGEMTVPLLFTMMDALSGRAAKPAGDHPSGVDRYKFLYRYLDERKDASRPLYDGTHDRREGAPFMTADQKADFKKLPTPDDVHKWAEQVAHTRSTMKDPSSGLLYFPQH
jgi:hypothetical protein